MTYDAAVASGAMALFGEKYDDEVRVLQLRRFLDRAVRRHARASHRRHRSCSRSSARAASQAGVRRIEAVTGQGALDWVAQSDQVLRDLAALVKASRDDVEDKVRQLVERSRKLEKEVAGLKSKLASGQGSDLSSCRGRCRGRQGRRDARRRRGRACVARRRRSAEEQAALGSNRARLGAGARQSRADRRRHRRIRSAS